MSSDYSETFSKEQIKEASNRFNGMAGCTLRSGLFVSTDALAAFAFAQMERAEKAEAERDEARRELAEADAILKEILEEMEEVDASGGWEGDEGLFNRGMEYLRARERGNQYARVQKRKENHE